MYKAIGSKKDISEHSQLSYKYYETIKDIINLPDITKLNNYSQHLNTSRLQHSINVSYYSYKLAKLLKLNERAAARAGLMHDLYFYEFSSSSLTCVEHSKLHSKLAVENAKKIVDINYLEEDIILTHMWPLTKQAPRHMEGFVVTMADKGCAFLEVMVNIPKLFKSKKPFMPLRNKRGSYLYNSIPNTAEMLPK